MCSSHIHPASQMLFRFLLHPYQHVYVLGGFLLVLLLLNSSSVLSYQYTLTCVAFSWSIVNILGKTPWKKTMPQAINCQYFLTLIQELLSKTIFHAKDDFCLIVNRSFSWFHNHCEFICTSFLRLSKSRQFSHSFEI